jgi:glucokinase
MSILAIDFGGTRTRAAWFNEALQQMHRAEVPTLRHEPQEQVIQRVIDCARSVVPDGEQPRVIGICAPGPQAFTGYILHANTLPGWDRVPLAERISVAFGGVPVAMENDANLAALAEYHQGAAQGCDPALYLTLSTGIGGGAILGGQLFTGWRGLAIEPGHLKFLHPDGRTYSLEALASGPALVYWAERALASGDAPSRLREMARLDGRVIGMLAAEGDAVAGQVVAEAGRWLGLGLVALTHLFNPQVIVLGGSVTQLGALLLEPVRRTLAQLLIDPAFNDPGLLRLAALGDDVCLIGAAYHARGRG